MCKIKIMIVIKIKIMIMIYWPQQNCHAPRMASVRLMFRPAHRKLFNQTAA
jgi:hypothetical protein